MIFVTRVTLHARTCADTLFYYLLFMRGHTYTARPCFGP